MSSAENPTERQQTADSECKGQRSQLSDCRHLGQMNTERLPPPSVLTDVTWSCFHVCLPSWCKLIVSHPPPAGDDGVYAELPDCWVSFSYKVWRKSIFRDHKLEMMDDHMTCTHSFSNRRFKSTETEPEHSGRVRTDKHWAESLFKASVCSGWVLGSVSSVRTRLQSITQPHRASCDWCIVMETN